MESNLIQSHLLFYHLARKEVLYIQLISISISISISPQEQSHLSQAYPPQVTGFSTLRPEWMDDK